MQFLLLSPIFFGALKINLKLSIEYIQLFIKAHNNEYVYISKLFDGKSLIIKTDKLIDNYIIFLKCNKIYAYIGVDTIIQNISFKKVDMLTIPFSNKEGNATINIVDVTGKIVSTQVVNLTGVNTLKLDVTSIESGMYVFNVAYENGTSSTFNVVINK